MSGITLIYETAASCHHGLYPGHEQLAGHGHGVLLEAAHHLLNLADHGVQNVQRSP
jgi:hypothetical protein